eukprot:GHVP01068302.1.p1 GENE.GHVP01068302.1~~GHVP01068302.1.p1  ORF type:complete len:341 (-),score=57.06 GHVP01068302.1:143-1165(-)
MTYHRLAYLSYAISNQKLGAPVPRRCFTSGEDSRQILLTSEVNSIRTAQMEKMNIFITEFFVEIPESARLESYSCDFGFVNKKLENKNSGKNFSFNNRSKNPNRILQQSFERVTDYRNGAGFSNWISPFDDSNTIEEHFQRLDDTRDEEHRFFDAKKAIQDIYQEKSIESNSGVDKTPGVKKTEIVMPPQKRYVPNQNRFIQEVFNEYVYGPWAVGWGHDFIDRTTKAQVGSRLGFVGLGTSINQLETTFNTAWKSTLVHASFDERDQSSGVGILKGRYGVNIDRSNVNHATAAQIIARNSEFATLTDFVDENYGQRVRIRDFEINFQHDFDDYRVAGKI